jgi:hypothetical protein
MRNPPPTKPGPPWTNLDWRRRAEAARNRRGIPVHPTPKPRKDRPHGDTNDNPR